MTSSFKITLYDKFKKTSEDIVMSADSEDEFKIILKALGRINIPDNTIISIEREKINIKPKLTLIKG